ncbi:MAG: DUF6520 family protein [Flavobacterium sp.]
MKKFFLKNMMPAVVTVLAVSGAFATMSMKNVSEKEAFKWGYLPNPSGGCSNVRIACDDTPKSNLCRVNGDSGAIAYNPDTNCVQPLYRP